MITMAWTCSDLVHHEHRTWLRAWLCGQWQWVKFNAPRLKCCAGCGDRSWLSSTRHRRNWKCQTWYGGDLAWLRGDCRRMDV